MMSQQTKVKIAVVGAGFGSQFYFHLHPNCEVVAVADESAAGRSILQNIYSCNLAYGSLTDLLANRNVEAVAIFTPAPYHAAHSIEALEAGKHVLCAVPVGMTVDECRAVKYAAERTGLIYMMAETSVFRQDTISSRQFYEAGEFGKLIAAEASYHHPGLEKYFFDHQGRPTWRHGLPPMLYSTHCTSFLLAVTQDVITSVSCVGWGDDDPILKNNAFNNPFWNQTALFQTSHQTAFKVNISWKGALMPTDRCEWHGEKMSFYSKDPKGIPSSIVRLTDVDTVDDAGFLTSDPQLEVYQQPIWWVTDMLPSELRIESGHDGSHTFITHEFIQAIKDDRSPFPDIRQSINYTIPGILAHESSLRGGECLAIPRYEDL